MSPSCPVERRAGCPVARAQIRQVSAVISDRTHIGPSDYQARRPCPGRWSKYSRRVAIRRNWQLENRRVITAHCGSLRMDASSVEQQRRFPESCPSYPLQHLKQGARMVRPSTRADLNRSRASLRMLSGETPAVCRRRRPQRRFILRYTTRIAPDATESSQSFREPAGRDVAEHRTGGVSAPEGAEPP